MNQPFSIDWWATLNTGEIIEPGRYRGRNQSPWSCLKEECEREGKYIVDLVFRYGQLRFPPGANADGYWMAGSVEGVMGQPELMKTRIGVGRVEGDKVLITWFGYPQGVQYEERPATDPCIIWRDKPKPAVEVVEEIEPRQPEGLWARIKGIFK